MEIIQSLTFWKKSVFILALILGAFFLKGVFLATLSPIFVGQDEARHYNSLQLLAEPRPVTWNISYRKESDEDSIRKYNYSKEIQETAETVGYDEANDNIYNTTSFANENFFGKNEIEINQKKRWTAYNENYPVNSAGTSLYHRISSTLIEKPLDSQNIFVRYYLARIFSVILGMLTVLLAYLIIKNTGFSKKSSLLMTAIIAFQPRFSIYTAAINYDSLLIAMFALFTLGGVLALKQGLNWKNILILVASVLLAIFTKATGNILLVPLAILLAYFSYEKIKDRSRKAKITALSVLILSSVVILFQFVRYTGIGLNNYSGLITSVGNYLSESLTMGRFALSSRTYWGTLGWVNNRFLENATGFIWYFQIAATAGLAYFLISKKKFEFLPEKKYIIFFLLMIVLLQLGIRTVDWVYYFKYGKLETGTPGRYFLPNIIAHIILVFTGIGAILGYFKKEKHFENFLLAGLLLMMLFMIYLIFDVIILRYYL